MELLENVMGQDPGQEESISAPHSSLTVSHETFSCLIRSIPVTASVIAALEPEHHLGTVPVFYLGSNLGIYIKIRKTTPSFMWDTKYIYFGPVEPQRDLRLSVQGVTPSSVEFFSVNDH